MRYRVVEDLDRPARERYVVQHSPFGHTWSTDGAYPDQITAEIEMEKLAAGPRVISKIETSG